MISWGDIWVYLNVTIKLALNFFIWTVQGINAAVENLDSERISVVAI